MSAAKSATDHEAMSNDASETTQTAELKSFPRTDETSRKPDTAATVETTPVSAEPNRPGRRRAILAGIALLLLAGAGWYGHEWWTVGRFMVSTDNAYVEADIATISPKVSGYIDKVLVSNNQHVKAGDPLATLDDGDYRIAADQAKAQIATQELTLKRIDAQIGGAEAALAQAKAQREALAAAEQTARETYMESARALGRRRREAGTRLTQQIQKQLKALGMKAARLETVLEESKPGPDGLEEVEFRFSANPGQPLRALAKVASGGELSRVSLAIQVICARNLTVPSLVFDEVDVGVGGGVAEIVGRLLRELGEHAQVLCITHQPQVAAQGHQHWQVHKIQGKDTTHTRIQSLDTGARVEEVARMLGGVEITESTLTHAREMLDKGQRVA